MLEQYYTFVFPKKPELLQQLTNEQIDHKLREQSEQQGLRGTYFYSYYRNLKRGRQFRKCNKCAAYLRFKIQNDKMKLYEYDTLHRHKDKVLKQSTKTYYLLKQAKKQKMSEKIVQQETDSFLKDQLRQIKNKSYGDSLLEFLSQVGIEYKALDVKPNSAQRLEDCTEQKFPCYVIASPQMKALYEKYSDFCYFHEEDYNFRVIYSFYGRDSSNRVIKFGMVMNSKYHLFPKSYLLKEFFDFLGHPPATLITLYNVDTMNVIKEFREKENWNGTHLVDSTVLVDSFNRGVKELELRGLLIESLDEINLVRFTALTKKAKQMMGSEKDKMYNKFKEFSHNFCMSLTPPVLHGLRPTTAFFAGEAKPNFQQEFETFPKTASWLTFEYYQKKEKKEDSIELRAQLSKKLKFHEISVNLKQYSDSVLQVLYKLLKKAEKVKLQINNSDECYSIEEDPILKISIKNIVSNGQKITCTCMNLEKTGLPCCHLIAVCLVNKVNFCLLINKRWRRDLTEKDS